MSYAPKFHIRVLVSAIVLLGVAAVTLALEAGTWSSVQAQTNTETPMSASATPTAASETLTPVATTTPSVGAPGIATRTDIGVSGTGRVSVSPDTAIASVGVEITAPTLDEATASSNTIMTEVLDAIRSAGVADEDIQTTGYNIFPITNIGAEGQTPAVTGYRVNNIVTIKIRNIDDVSTVLDAALQAGANSINSVTFVVNDTTEAENRARTLAVRDAMAKASGLAQAAGVSVGPLVSLSELPANAIPFSGVAAAPAIGGAGPIQTGMNDIIVTVEMHFEIAE